MKIELKTIENGLELGLDGIFEGRGLPDIPDAHKELVVDLTNLKDMTSIGKGTWMEWIDSVSSKFETIAINHAPEFFLKDAMREKHLKPENAKVYSAYIRYACEDEDNCSEEYFRLVELDKMDDVPEEIKCTGRDCSDVMTTFNIGIIEKAKKWHENGQ